MLKNIFKKGRGRNFIFTNVWCILRHYLPSTNKHIINDVIESSQMGACRVLRGCDLKAEGTGVVCVLFASAAPCITMRGGEETGWPRSVS